MEAGRTCQRAMSPSFRHVILTESRTRQASHAGASLAAAAASAAAASAAAAAARCASRSRSRSRSAASDSRKAASCSSRSRRLKSCARSTGLAKPYPYEDAPSLSKQHYTPLHVLFAVCTSCSSRSRRLKSCARLRVRRPSVSSIARPCTSCLLSTHCKAGSSSAASAPASHKQRRAIHVSSLCARQQATLQPSHALVHANSPPPSWPHPPRQCSACALGVLLLSAASAACA